MGRGTQASAEQTRRFARWVGRSVSHAARLRRLKDPRWVAFCHTEAPPQAAAESAAEDDSLPAWKLARRVAIRARASLTSLQQREAESDPEDKPQLIRLIAQARDTWEKAEAHRAALEKDAGALITVDDLRAVKSRIMPRLKSALLAMRNNIAARLNTAHPETTGDFYRAYDEETRTLRAVLADLNTEMEQLLQIDEGEEASRVS